MQTDMRVRDDPPPSVVSSVIEEAWKWREAAEAIEMAEKQLQAEAEDAIKEVAEVDEMTRIKYCKSLALKIQLQQEGGGAENPIFAPDY